MPTTSIMSFQKILRSPLRSPIRPSLRLQTCTQLQSLVSSPIPQCRSMSLYKYAMQKNTLGLHKLLAFSPYEPPYPKDSTHTINLWSGPKENATIVAQDVSLDSLVKDHIRTGKLLLPRNVPSKAGKAMTTVEEFEKSNVACEMRDYYIADHNPNVQVSKEVKRHLKDDPTSATKRVPPTQGLKEIHINLGSPQAHYQESLNRAYVFLLTGHAVELQNRLSGTMVDKENRYEATETGKSAFSYLYAHFPHLRPDVILKSMPRGTYFMAHPFSDGRKVSYILSLPTQTWGRRILTAKLNARKKKVLKSVEAGRQSQLPKVLRKKLILEGKTEYSLDTGRVLKEVVSDRRFGDDKARFGEESLDATGSLLLRRERRAYGRLTKSNRNDVKFRWLKRNGLYKYKDEEGQLLGEGDHRPAGVRERSTVSEDPFKKKAPRETNVDISESTGFKIRYFKPTQ